MTQHPDLFAALAAPFDSSEVKLRSQSGRQLSYITARTVMNRLDDVLGPENWWDRYVPGENSVLCELTIRLPDGSTLTKSDAGGYAGMADSGDDDKSGYSDSFKRTAVKFGVARYLYRDGVPTFVRERTPSADVLEP
ncbi:Rad52/Rad22 family DNA repair protein, partial [Singulisphaera rosea]